MQNQQLVDYIKNQISLGADREQIRKASITSGSWSEKDVDDAFFTIADSIKPPLPPMSEWNSKVILNLMVDEYGVARLSLEVIVLIFYLVMFALFTCLGKDMLDVLIYTTPFTFLFILSLRHYKKWTWFAILLAICAVVLQFIIGIGSINTI